MPDRVCNFRPLLYLSPHNRHQRAPPSGGLASSWILVTLLSSLLFLCVFSEGGSGAVQHDVYNRLPLQAS